MPRTFEYFRWIVKQRGIWISHHTQRHSMTVKYLKEPLNFVNDYRCILQVFEKQ